MQRQRGLSALEFALVVGLIGILLVVFIERAMRLDAAIERTTVQYTVHNIETALALEMARRVRADPERHMAALADSNPMAELMVPPPNYLGELDDPETAEPGHWYFDSGAGLLIYLPRYPRQIHTPLAGPVRLRFRVVHGGNDGPLSGGLQLRPEESYRWLPEGNG